MFKIPVFRDSKVGYRKVNKYGKFIKTELKTVCPWITQKLDIIYK